MKSLIMAIIYFAIAVVLWANVPADVFDQPLAAITVRDFLRVGTWGIFAWLWLVGLDKELFA